jgi:hypothetical protein
MRAKPSHVQAAAFFGILSWVIGTFGHEGVIFQAKLPARFNSFGTRTDSGHS